MPPTTPPAASASFPADAQPSGPTRAALHWTLVQGLFHGALERTTGERAAWLAAAAGTDAALVADVEALLAADAERESVLDRAPSEVLDSEPTARDAREPLTAGDRVGTYRIVRRLGRGGMGVVYLADDERHGTPVALKVLRPAVAAALAPENARARFLREIRIGTSLVHPALLPVLDAGIDGALPWLTMPFVDGETLRGRLLRDGPLDVDAVLAVGGALAGGLAWLHARGIVHRDVKPENVLLAGDGSVRLGDFGVARAVEVADADGQLTASGVVVGTARYMSPEQFHGAPADARADVYALGCVLYEALAGEPPYRGAALRATLVRPTLASPPDVRHRRPEVPVAVAAAIARAIAPDPERRPAAADLAAALGASTE